ncbi:transcriptional regulator, MerR family [Roseibium hamelinense]|uniref:Transcriptional regulator, MerR family n=1 Tax=Roseibium hamelinense TaxID=150831 RepID=A0A562T362_9HYPH|nr:helix-turn-helix domain-containing protein [Roseibium hamelinense]MTI44594.1 MerR family transcriptional regulator [Roseibium hamelinense]TWI87220.1 transcriptional regulator, MerR family [Roseibium hamelinense]
MDFSIGDLARKTGVKVPTIRYYEKEGLIDTPVRTQGNQRRYFQKDLERLAFIRHARNMGLPMTAIRALLALSERPDQPCADADRIAKEQLREVRSRIRQLQKLEVELERISSSCEGGTRAADCQVLKAFADHTLCSGEH